MLRSIALCAWRLDGVESLFLDRVTQAVEHLVDLRPALQLLYVVEPALDVRILAEVAADDLAQRHQACPEIVGDGDLVAGEILLVRADPMVVEQLQPALRALLAPVDGRGMDLVCLALVVRE